MIKAKQKITIIITLVFLITSFVFVSAQDSPTSLLKLNFSGETLSNEFYGTVSFGSTENTINSVNYNHKPIPSDVSVWSDEDVTGIVGGYAWSSNFGWIEFPDYVEKTDVDVAPGINRTSFESGCSETTKAKCYPRVVVDSGGEAILKGYAVDINTTIETDAEGNTGDVLSYGEYIDLSDISVTLVKSGGKVSLKLTGTASVGETDSKSTLDLGTNISSNEKSPTHPTVLIRKSSGDGSELKTISVGEGFSISASCNDYRKNTTSLVGRELLAIPNSERFSVREGIVAPFSSSVLNYVLQCSDSLLGESNKTLKSLVVEIQGVSLTVTPQKAAAPSGGGGVPITLEATAFKSSILDSDLGTEIQPTVNCSLNKIVPGGGRQNVALGDEDDIKSTTNRDVYVVNQNAFATITYGLECNYEYRKADNTLVKEFTVSDTATFTIIQGRIKSSEDTDPEGN